jgi:hypothetical protein
LAALYVLGYVALGMAVGFFATVALVVAFVQMDTLLVFYLAGSLGGALVGLGLGVRAVRRPSGTPT